MFTCEDKGFSKEAAEKMYKLAVKKDKPKKSLPKSLGQRKDVKDSSALAADIGRDKYGKKKFQQMAAKGKTKSAALQQSAFNMGFCQRVAELKKNT